jgi:peptidase MA superfamily protein
MLAMLCVLPSLGASYRTDNFAVEAESNPVARQVANAAEKCRNRIAVQWLGKRAVDWPDVCTIEVELSDKGRYGVSRFTYSNDELQGAHITLRGPLNEILPRVLPHEVTHTVLMRHFGRPIPRWADEGAAVLAEDASRKEEYDRKVLGNLARKGRSYSLRFLLGSQEYPRNLDIFYPQSYSVTRFLVEARGRKTFLAFIEHGMDHGWDDAVQVYYRYDDVDELEQAWREHMKVVEARLAIHGAIRSVRLQVPALWSRSHRIFAPPFVPPETVAMPQ